MGLKKCFLVFLRFIIILTLTFFFTLPFFSLSRLLPAILFCVPLPRFPSQQSTRVPKTFYSPSPSARQLPSLLHHFRSYLLWYWRGNSLAHPRTFFRTWKIQWKQMPSKSFRVAVALLSWEISPLSHDLPLLDSGVQLIPCVLFTVPWDLKLLP